MEKYEQGDIVRITDNRRSWENWEKKAKELGATKFFKGHMLVNSSIATIISFDRGIFLLRCIDTGYEVLMSGEGFCLVEKYKYCLSKIDKSKSSTSDKIQQKEKSMANDIVGKVSGAGKKVIGAQKEFAKTAATLEAARIFNNQLAKIATKKLPMMVRGYADTPVGRAVMANMVLIGLETTLPHIDDNDIRKQVLQAAVVESYGALMQTFKLEDMLNELFEMPALKGVVSKIGLSKEE